MDKFTMILTIRMSATPDKSKPNIDKIIKSNKHLRRCSTFFKNE